MTKKLLACGLTMAGLMATGAFAADHTNGPKTVSPLPGVGTVKTKAVDLGDGVKLDLVWMPAGTFMMGSPATDALRYDDEGPQHQVTISKGFWMGKYPVTQAQWEKVMGNNPSEFKKAGPTAPVEQVSWADCQEYIQKLNLRPETGNLKFRLPTEAEWEYACRAGTTTRFYTGDNNEGLGKAGWYKDNSGGATHPVGQKQPNAFGLYDMHGNVWQWCQDWRGNYSSASGTDPEGPSSTEMRVLRGGSWYGTARGCRSAYRGDGYAPTYRTPRIGFRLVLVAR